MPPEKSSVWKKILMNVSECSANMTNHEDLLKTQNGRPVPKVNGKHNKKVKEMSLNINGATSSQPKRKLEAIFSNIPMYKEVLPGLDSWQASKVAAWHNVEGCSIQWLCAICIDRKGSFSPSQKARLPVTQLLRSYCNAFAE